MQDKIAGYYVLDDPEGGPTSDGCEDGFLHVEKRSDGQWYDTEIDVVITAFEVFLVENLIERLNAAVEQGMPNTLDLPQRIIPFDEPTPVMTVIEDEDLRRFVPSSGECERVGLPIRRLRH